MNYKNGKKRKKEKRNYLTFKWGVFLKGVKPPNTKNNTTRYYTSIVRTEVWPAVNWRSI